ncbi:MAG: histidinol-phosphatase [Pseudomonadota bacterium]
MNPFLATAHQLADLARPIAKRYFRAHTHDLGAVDKADLSPVTLADQAIEAAIRAHLRQTHPHHGIIGEEAGRENDSAAYQWVIDPIDGTKSFMAGKPQFGTLVALLHHGQPMLGLIDQAILNERWWGLDGQAFFNHQPLSSSGARHLSEAIVFTTTPDMWTDKAVLARLQTQCKRIVYGGDCYNYAMLAMGHIDAVVELDLKPHDFLCLPPIIEAAGGKIVDWSGNALHLGSDGRVIAVAEPKLLPELLACLHG